MIAGSSQRTINIRCSVIGLGTAVDNALASEIIQMVLVVQVLPVDLLSSPLGDSQEERTAYKADEMILLHQGEPVSGSDIRFCNAAETS